MLILIFERSVPIDGSLYQYYVRHCTLFEVYLIRRFGNCLYVPSSGDTLSQSQITLLRCSLRTGRGSSVLTFF